MSAELTKAAIRALRMTDEERADALDKCSHALRERLEAEMAAINWVRGSVLIWAEHGAGLDIIQYFTDEVNDVEQAKVPAGV